MPRDRLLREHGGEQIELLVEQLLVLVEVEAEERKRFDKGATSEDDLGAPIRHRIQRRKSLENPNGIVR